jgi:hypothetical protein
MIAGYAMGLISRKRLDFGDGSLEIDVVPEMLADKILASAKQAVHDDSDEKRASGGGGAPPYRVPCRKSIRFREI